MPHRRDRLHALGLAFVLLTAPSCALDATYVADEVLVVDAPVGEPAVSLLLIGDAGLAEAADQPVLGLLREEVLRAPERTVVLFLGDNVYPSGLREGNEEDERRLQAQVDAVAHTGARIVFLAGNHDVRADGVSGLERQAARLAETDDPRLSFLPGPGCPGPTVLDLAGDVRLVLLDSTWWFRDEDERTDCDAPRTDDVAAAIGEAVAAPGRRVVVAAHHPSRSHGPHGGLFPWQTHLFPLRDVWSPLWVPLPILGSVIPTARWLGVSSTDRSSSEYRGYLTELERALAPHPPFALVGGHEHSLQVLRGELAEHVIVSGAGTLDRLDTLTARGDTLVASPRAGFVRLDFAEDGRVVLTLHTVEGDGSPSEPARVELAR